MKLQIGVAIADIPPISLIDQNAAQFFAAPNEVEEGWDNGALHSALEKIHKFAIDEINAGENEFIGGAGSQLIANVEHAAASGVERYLFWPGTGTQRQRNNVAAGKVSLYQRRQRQIGENIPVVNEKWLVP
jgi:hypothetical protein